MDGYAVRYPAEEARLANWLYPCFTGKAKSDTSISFLKPDTTWVPTVNSGEVVPIKDEVGIVSGAGLTALSGITTFTGSAIQRITTHEVKTVHDTVVDQRALAAMRALYTASNNSLKKAQGQNGQLETEKDGWRKWVWILAGILAAELVGGIAYFVIKIYTKIP